MRIKLKMLSLIPTKLSKIASLNALFWSAGSGIHLDSKTSTLAEPDLQARLKPLSRFQRHILSHALRFPSAQTVVYSTCSVYEEEDEDVIFNTLETDEFAGQWTVQGRKDVLPDWPLRGSNGGGTWDNKKEQLDGLIRCERRLGTHGFFVAVLVRKDTQASDEPAPAREEDASTAEGGLDQSVQAGKGTGLDKSDFSLLRLATIDSRRRRKLSAKRRTRRHVSAKYQ